MPGWDLRRLVSSQGGQAIRSARASAWSELNQSAGYRSNELIFQVYDQIQVTNAFFLEPALTLSTPGETSARRPAVAFTLQSTILF